MSNQYPTGVARVQTTPAPDLKLANAYIGILLQKLSYPDYARAVRESTSSLFVDWCAAGRYKRDRSRREALIAERLGTRDIPDASYLNGFLHDIFLDARHPHTEERQLAAIERVSSLHQSALSSRADNWCITRIISKVEPENYLADKPNSLDTSLYIHWRENGRDPICLRPLVPDDGLHNYRTRALLHTLFSYVEHPSHVQPRLSHCFKNKQAFLRRLVAQLPDDLRVRFSKRMSIGVSGDDRFEYRTCPRGKSFSDHSSLLH